MILSEHTHFSPDSSGICAHCGQPLPGQSEPRYGEQRVNRTGLAIAVGLHVLLVLIYLFKPAQQKPAPAASGEAITYVAPVPAKPTRREQAAAAPRKRTPAKTVVPKVERLPNTITLPDEPKVVEEVPPEKLEPSPAPPELSMEEMIAAKRRARGQDTTQQQGELSERDRGMQNALANIAAANGRSKGGGVDNMPYWISNQSFSRATINYRSFNKNFKRDWLQQVQVELGSERDIETAIVKTFIEMMRKESEKYPMINFNSRRLGRDVPMDFRPEARAELEAFIFKELFPDYRPPRAR